VGGWKVKVNFSLCIAYGWICIGLSKASPFTFTQQTPFELEISKSPSVPTSNLGFTSKNNTSSFHQGKVIKEATVE
jgi:hypothetical protein